MGCQMVPTVGPAPRLECPVAALPARRRWVECTDLAGLKEFSETH